MRTSARVLIMLVVVAATAVIASRIVLPKLNGADVSSLSTQALFAASLPDPSDKVTRSQKMEGQSDGGEFLGNLAPALLRRNAGTSSVTG